MNRFAAVALLCLCLIVSNVFGQSTLPTTLAAREFPRPDRIRYDSQCLTIDGQDTLVFSGAFHYFRCPKPLWRERFRKIKEAGFNTVETYVAWNWHEREMPASVDDFSKVDMTDLADWMKMAHQEFGLYTIIRPGPYICAEWAGGGFPAWLNLKRPDGYPADRPWMRSDEPEFLKWSKHWLDACDKVIAPEQITRKPVGSRGVILYQIENEYDYCRDFDDQKKVTHLKALYRAAVDGGIDVPIFTCWTKQIRGSRDPDLRNVFDGINSYPRWGIQGTGGAVDTCRREQPDAPSMIPECQGGWFAQVGGVLSEKQDGVTAAQCNGITMMALSHGVTILNYYMLFGGTNLGDWGGRQQTTTYDYAAPIRETGAVGDKYLAVKGIGAMLEKIGPTLARSKQIQCTVQGFDSNVFVTGARIAPDGQTFVFFWNRSRDKSVEGLGTIQLAGQKPLQLNCQLEPFGFKVLWQNGEETAWLPEAPPPILRPAVPGSIKITDARRAKAPEPAQWTDIKPGDNVQRHGVYGSDYVMYRSKVSLTDEQAAKYKSVYIDQKINDPVLVRVNGRLIANSHYLRQETAVPLGDGVLRAGDNDITVLYEPLGYPNFGSGVEHAPGIQSGALVYSKTPDILLTQWKVQLTETAPPQGRGGGGGGGGGRGNVGAAAPTTQLTDNFDDSPWPGFVLDQATVAELGTPVMQGAEVKNAAARTLYGRNNSSAIFRTTIDVTQQMLDAQQTRLTFDRIDDRGIVYVNGREAGRSASWERPLDIDASKMLKVGKNVIAAWVSNRDGEGGLTRPVRFSGASVERLELNWQLAKDLPQPTNWEPVTLGSALSATADNALMTWYQVEFELPEASKDSWYPWLAKIDATGNGMIWLNGQHIGRWWQAGPQRDYFLPECWLNFGAGKKNTLTISLRPLDRGAVLSGIEIAPDAAASEKR